jgi:hypothetical protein
VSSEEDTSVKKSGSDLADEMAKDVVSRLFPGQYIEEPEVVDIFPEIPIKLIPYSGPDFKLDLKDPSPTADPEQIRNVAAPKQENLHKKISAIMSNYRSTWRQSTRLRVQSFHSQGDQTAAERLRYRMFARIAQSLQRLAAKTDADEFKQAILGYVERHPSFTRYPRFSDFLQSSPGIEFLARLTKREVTTEPAAAPAQERNLARRAA